jgi:DNA (cytosine-5)-methyltransferase 1
LDVLRDIGWGATCLTEDMEFTMKLCMNNIRVSFAYDAIVYDEKPITFGEFAENLPGVNDLSEYQYEVWKQRIKTDTNFSHILQRVEGRNSWFNAQLLHKERVAPTKTTGEFDYLYDEPRNCSEYEIKCISTFPQDYKYKGKGQLNFLTGMSVPPLMTAQIAYQIWKQWISRINNGK